MGTGLELVLPPIVWVDDSMKNKDQVSLLHFGLIPQKQDAGYTVLVRAPSRFSMPHIHGVLLVHGLYGRNGGTPCREGDERAAPRCAVGVAPAVDLRETAAAIPKTRSC